jgi:tRNA(adenine34) deaminase
MKFSYFIVVVFMLVNVPCRALHLHRRDWHSDAYYMQIAIELAQHNPKKPFAAIIVDNKTGKVIAKGINTSQFNPTFHGEMIAINACIKKHPLIDWHAVTLYTTAEPCPMCQGAIIWTGISRVVFGTSIQYLRNHHWKQINIAASEMNHQASFYKGTTTGGILAKKTDLLFTQ